MLRTKLICLKLDSLPPFSHGPFRPPTNFLVLHFLAGPFYLSIYICFIISSTSMLPFQPLPAASFTNWHLRLPFLRPPTHSPTLTPPWTLSSVSHILLLQIPLSRPPFPLNTPFKSSIKFTYRLGGTLFTPKSTIDHSFALQNLDRKIIMNVNP